MKNVKRMMAIAASGAMMIPVMAAAGKRPNIVYVFPDQMRNAALSLWSLPEYRQCVNFRGDPTVMPNLERFAKDALVLSAVQSNFPLSSPHRGMLLTGMYPNRSGIPLNCNTVRPDCYIRPETTCITDVFADAGYDCAYIGKLHADTPQKNDPANPGHYVEDKETVWDAYTPPERRHKVNFWYSYGTFDEHKNPHYWDNDGRKHEPKEWSPTYEAKIASKYILNRNGERDPEKPFIMMVGMNPPHSPYRSLSDCMEEDYELYADKPLSELLVRENADTTMKKARSAAYYFASVTGVDRAFGMILDALHEAGLDDNTIVVFSSDHGETMTSHGTEDPKNSPYSESMNVPFVIRYPRHIRHRVDPLLMSSPDIMPTLLGLAGLGESVPESVQGRDLSGLLTEKDVTVSRPECAIYIRNTDGPKDADGKVHDYFPDMRGVKTADYTLVFRIDRGRNLKEILFFDDKADPYQLTNLDPTTRKKEFSKLCKLMADELKRIGDRWADDRILSDYLPY